MAAKVWRWVTLCLRRTNSKAGLGYQVVHIPVRYVNPKSLTYILRWHSAPPPLDFSGRRQQADCHGHVKWLQNAGLLCCENDFDWAYQWNHTIAYHVIWFFFGRSNILLPGCMTHLWLSVPSIVDSGLNWPATAVCITSPQYLTCWRLPQYNFNVARSGRATFQRLWRLLLQMRLPFRECEIFLL